MDAAQPYFDEQQAKRDNELREEERRLREEDDWAKAELVMLRRRVMTTYEEVPLRHGDPGDTIRIRTGLTETELQMLVDLHLEEDEIRALAEAAGRGLTVAEQERMDEIMLIKIATATANPLITPAFLRENKDTYPISDALVAYSTVLPLVAAMAKKPVNMARFRPNKTG